MPAKLALTLSNALISALFAITASEVWADVVGPPRALAGAESPAVVEPLLLNQPSTRRIAESRPILYLAPSRPVVGHVGQMLPDSLTAPAALVPSGSLSWAGIHEATTMGILPEEPRSESAKQALLRELAAAEGPNVELLAGIAAPEPPALVLAGFAVAAGGLVAERNRRRSRTAG